MTEAAGPGGPTRADRWQLAFDGLRERFRLPPGRPLAVVAAVLALLIGGAFGAAVGSWAGMWTYPKVPAVGPVASQVVGSDATLQKYQIQERFVMVSAAELKPGLDATEVAGRARDRLTAAGWEPTAVVVSGGTDGIHYRRAAFTADKSGVRLDVAAYYSDTPQIEFRGLSMRPPTYAPLVIGGMVIGLLAGWLVAAALTYRIGGARRRRASAVTAGAGLALLLLPADSIYRYLIRYLPNHESRGWNEFVHRALASSPVPNAGLGWTDSAALNKNLVIAGLFALAAAAIIARPPQAGQEPDSLRRSSVGRPGGRTARASRKTPRHLDRLPRPRRHRRRGPPVAVLPVRSAP
jgi:hypothetical protein